VTLRPKGGYSKKGNRKIFLVGFPALTKQLFSGDAELERIPKVGDREGKKQVMAKGKAKGEIKGLNNQAA